jgi:hypothetical protein
LLLLLQQQGFVGIPQSIIVGLAGALVSNIAVSIKTKINFG